MWPLKSISAKIRSRSGKLSLNRLSTRLHRRQASLLMESLELRTLLSGNVPVNSPSTSSIAVATDSSHVYTGRPSTFGAITAGPSVSDLTSTSQAALAALSKVLKAQPQYFIMPSTGIGATPNQGDGPAGGVSPIQLRGAYGDDQVKFGTLVGDGTGQTIAVIDNGDNPSFLNTSDPNYGTSALAFFDQFFGLPDPPIFQKYNQVGTPISTGPNNGWGLEIALDVEYAHAMAPGANIDLVEANDSSFASLGTAANTAATLLGASVVSQSFGGYLENAGNGAVEGFLDQTYYAPALASNPGVTFLASTGDASALYGPTYPSVSPLTVGVGGTSLDVTGNTWTNEFSWAGGGGGISSFYTTAPSYQQESVTGFTARTVPDVSADSNGETGVSVYDPFDAGGWVRVSGTSIAAPTWAGLIAVADQGRVSYGGKPLNGPDQTLPGLYSSIDYSNNFHDITEDFDGEGNNGFPTGPGYDLDTGIGSPRAPGLLPALAAYGLPQVVSSNPAQGQVVTSTPPTTFSLTFTEPIEPGSIVASDFTVNGTPANSAALSSDGLTITYTFSPSPVVTQGTETMELPADSVIGALTGKENPTTFTASFYYVQAQLQVTATSPAVGSVITLPSPPGSIDLVVQFNKAFETSSISTSDFQVSQGSVVKAVPLTTQAVDLTISGVSQDGFLTLTIPAGAILDTLGVPGLGFTSTYFTDIVTEAYPTPLQDQRPAGSLIYDSFVTGTVSFVGDTDTYNLPLAAGQDITLVMTTGSGLIGTITLLGPGGTVIGSATSPSAGTAAVLQAAPVSRAGTYSFVVSGASGTTGSYRLQAILNAVYKQATDSVNTIGTALDLSSAFVSLGTTPSADRAGVVGTLGATPVDYYAIPLSAGQSTTIAVKGTSGTAGVELVDASGNPLALSTPGNGVDGVISDLAAPSTGVYYVEVTGAAGVAYDLVVTRGADFGLHGNSFDKAQPLNGVDVALGSILPASSPLYLLDDQLYGAFNPIYRVDPTTGDFTGPAIAAPGSPLNDPFGLNMAYDGTYLYYNNGPNSGDNTIYKLDPNTGAVITSFLPQEPFYLSGIAYFNGNLWGTDSANLYEMNPNTGAVLQEFANVFPGGNVTGLTADPDLGTLFAVSQSNTLYEIDPTTGAIINSGPDNAQGLNEQDLAYSNGLLIVSDSNGLASSGGTNVLDEYDPHTLAFVERVPVKVQGFASGLGGDGLGGNNADWYQFNVSAGDNLVITTTTPGGASGSGQQFENDLDPTINLYDASGKLVATATGNSGDGRNDRYRFHGAHLGQLPCAGRWLQPQ